MRVSNTRQISVSGYFLAEVIVNYFNPDFAVEIVMRVSNTRQISVSGYFLAEEIVIYFEVKKCSEMLSCAVVGSRNRFSTAKSGFKGKKCSERLNCAVVVSRNRFSTAKSGFKHSLI